jgi:hypothetical protein
MFEDPQPLVPPAVVVTEAAAPSPEVPCVDGTEQSPPSAEQAQAADQVFTGPVQRNPVATLFGVVSSALLLRDIAVDTFDTSAEDENDKRDSGGEEDAEPAD